MIDLCNKVKEVARCTGEYLRSEQPLLTKKDIELKGARDYVTYIDKESEKMVVAELSQLLPKSGFLTEEKTVKYRNEEFIWIIDPLDGTTNYVHGDSSFSVSIALRRNEETVLGVVYLPIEDQMFSATSEENAFLNTKRLQVSSHSKIKNAYLGFGIPYILDSRGEEILNNAIKQFKNCSFRIKGSAALEICYVAAGVSDGYFHSGLSPWDVAAATYILRCAGGRCTDFSGGNNYLFGRELVATNSTIHQEVLTNIIQAK